MEEELIKDGGISMLDNKTINKMLQQLGYNKEQLNDMYKEFVMGFDGSQIPSIGVIIKIDTSTL